MNTHPTDREQDIDARELEGLLPTPPVQEPSEDRLQELRRRVMGEIRAQRPRRRRRRLVAVIVVGAAAAALFTGVTIATESGSHRQDANDLRSTAATDLDTGSPSPYPTNANGQTYGPNHPGSGTPELMLAHAERGENGYMYWSDAMGPVPGPGEFEWFAATRGKQREVPLYQSDGVTQVGVFLAGNGDETAEQPPVWLFDRMKDMAAQAGDADAWAWFVLTTNEQAAVATGNSTKEMTDPERPVYLTVLLGDFTNWLWSLRERAETPEYSWIFQIIDPESHQVFMTGAGTKPFEGAQGLDLNIVGLRDQVRL
jgi:hypothetical protein